MAAFDPATLDRWRALAIVDRDGTTVGTVSEFYLDRETGYPTWALVNTGLFGATQTFVPLVHATEISDGLQVPYDKRHIKDTPTVNLHDELSPEEEAELFTHYGVDYQPLPETASGMGWAGTEAAGPGGPADSGAGGSLDQGTAGAASAGDPGGSGAAAPEATEGVSGPGEPPGSVRADTEAGPSERQASADGGPVSDEGPGAVPAEPGSADAAATVDAEADPPRDEADLGRDEAATGQSGPDSGPVPAEPGTTEPGEATPPHVDRGPFLSTPPAPDPADSGAAEPDPAVERSRTGDHDPDLARTAPVEPGLPGSTASSPYGAPTTVDKAAHPPEPSAEEPLGAPDEPGWAPGAAGSFEEHEPFDRTAGASDRWREAKLAAERDRIARAAASQPEERSPLERARRRLERLVGVGQDHPDPDELSPADQETAERARRARLGMDEDDRR